jgi:hypothetical protein
VPTQLNLPEYIELSQPNLRELYVRSLRDLTNPYIGWAGLGQYYGEPNYAYIEIIQCKIYEKWRYEKGAIFKKGAIRT